MTVILLMGMVAVKIAPSRQASHVQVEAHWALIDVLRSVVMASTWDGTNAMIETVRLAMDAVQIALLN